MYKSVLQPSSQSDHSTDTPNSEKIKLLNSDNILSIGAFNNHLTFLYCFNKTADKLSKSLTRDGSHLQGDCAPYGYVLCNL
jgi:hypothetical protein